MPIVDDAFANSILDALAGPGVASGMPSQLWVAYYDFDPRDTGVEISGGGYARLGPISMSSGTMWPNATGRTKTNGASITGPSSSGAWSAIATWAAFVTTSSGAGTVGWAQELPVPVVVDGPGQRAVIAVGDLAIPILDDFGSF